MNDSASIEESWEARCERREQEEERREAHAYADQVQAAYADPDAPPRAPDSVIRLTGATGEEPQGAIGLLITDLITGSLEHVNLIPVLDIPLDATVIGMSSTDGAELYQVLYTDQDCQNRSIDLGPNRVIAEWAEGILAERKWRASPSCGRWRHPRPSDL